MDARYRARWAELKGEIVARVGGGALLKDVCAGSGMPSEAAVLAWRRKDPGFDAEMAAAMARGAARRDAFDPGVARGLLLRMSEGEPLHSVLRDPAMPSRRRLRLWLAQDPGFAEALHLMKQGRASVRVQRLRERFRPFDQDTADRIIVRLNRGEGLREMLDGDPTLPSAAIVQRWRRENPEFGTVVRMVQAAWARRRARARLFSEELKEEILARIVTGGSFNSLSRDPAMPCRKTLGAWVRTRPDFAREVAMACEHREDWYADQVFELGMTGLPEARRAMGPLKRQLVRLRNRPGRKRDSKKTAHPGERRDERG